MGNFRQNMDKVTQAMVANKTAALKTDVKKNMLPGIFGEKDDEKREKEETKQNNKFIYNMEKRREQEGKQRLEAHRKLDRQREKNRQQIREKYKLRGYDKSPGEYHFQGGHEVMFTTNTEQNNTEKQEEESSCIIM